MARHVFSLILATKLIWDTVLHRVKVAELLAPRFCLSISKCPTFLLPSADRATCPTGIVTAVPSATSFWNLLASANGGQRWEMISRELLQALLGQQKTHPPFPSTRDQLTEPQEKLPFILKIQAYTSHFLFHVLSNATRKEFPKELLLCIYVFPLNFDLSQIIVDRKDDMFCREILYIVKILVLKRSKWSFVLYKILKNNVLQNFNTHKKEHIKVQNIPVDQIWVLGCCYLFQGKQTFRISTFLPDSKQTKFWQSCLFYGEMRKLFRAWLCQASPRK